jgi:tRNA threonylcarbamoyladenosine biosynthesis protein TsaB
MRILAIDSSVPIGSVALLDKSGIISQDSIARDSSFSILILPKIREITIRFGLLSLEQLDGFALTTGPGSFTGLRVGMSLIKGIALGLGKPVVAIETLLAIAAQVDSHELPICAILDAKKKQVYAAFFKREQENLVRQSPDIAISPEDLIKNILEPTIFVGQGLEVYGDFFANKLKSYFIRNQNTNQNSVAGNAGILALKNFQTLKVTDLDQLTIKYARKSEAEINLERLAIS